MLHSFDVFDTCLARRVVAPTDAFLEMAPEIARVLGVDPDEAWTAELAWARIRGETLARQRSSMEDVGLGEIWKETCRLLEWPYSPRYEAAELATEERLLYPVRETLEEVRRGRALGARIVFVSDTYFPREFVGRLLNEHGFMKEGDGLYVSSEVGKVKWTGSLFDHVIREEGVRPSVILHSGDNAHSDGEAARAKGIRPRVVAPAALSPAERCVARTNLYGGDASRWAGAMRMSRIGVPGRDAQGTLHAVSQFIGPVLLSFAGWVIEQARALGVKRLYFASRDCQMLCRVVDLVRAEESEVEARYLYISRQSLLLPTLRRVAPEAMPWMRRSFERHDLRTLLGKVGLEWTDLDGAWGASVEEEGWLLRNEEAWSRFWEVLQSPEVSDLIMKRAGTRRENAVAYFRQEGLLDDVPAALVDFGWSLTSQRALNQLLLEEGRGGPLPGLYLQHILDRPEKGATGPVRVLFPPLPPDRRDTLGGVTPHDYANVVEHTLGLADHLSVDRYEQRDGRLVPFAASGPVRSQEGGLARRVAEEVYAFAAAHRHLITPDASRRDDVVRGRIGAILTEVLRKPTEELVRELASIRCSKDQDHRFARPLARPLTFMDELASEVPGFQGTKVGEPLPEWAEGSLCLTPPNVRRAAALLRGMKARIPRGVKTRVKGVLR